MYDLSGKVALVTGVSNKRGVGCGIALGLAREGANVVVTDIHKSPEKIDPWDKEEGWEGLNSVVTKIEANGSKGLAITADLSDSGEITRLVERALDEFGKIDILVNNAAVLSKDTGTPSVVDFPEQEWRKTINVNLTAPFLLCKAVLPQMIKRGQGGKILNISSMAGKMGAPGRAAYSASKFGLLGLTQVLANEVGRHNINVNAVCLGLIATWGSMGYGIWEGMKLGLSEEQAIEDAYGVRWGRPAKGGSAVEEAVTKIFGKGGGRPPPLGRVGMVEDVVNVILFLLSSKAEYIHGQAINIDGGALMTH